MMMRDRSTFLSWTFAFITQIHLWTYSLQGVRWWRNSLIDTAILMSRLRLNQDILLMFWCGPLAITKRLFKNHYWVFPNYCSMKASIHLNHFAWESHHILQQFWNLLIAPMLSHLMTTKFSVSQRIMMTISLCYLWQMKRFIKKMARELTEKSHTSAQSHLMEHWSTKFALEMILNPCWWNTSIFIGCSWHCMIPLTPLQWVTKTLRIGTSADLWPQSLDDDQWEFMELHYKMNHSFPAMIVLAEKGKIKAKYSKLKHRLPMCMYCIFGKAHHKPWHIKGSESSIRKESSNAPGKYVSLDQLD